MRYTVLVSAEAEADLEKSFQWLAANTPQHAPEWHNALIDSLNSLETNPARCPVVEYDDDAAEEYRQLLFGNKRHAHRILFYIRGDKVWIGRIVHAARDI